MRNKVAWMIILLFLPVVVWMQSRSKADIVGPSQTPEDVIVQTANQDVTTIALVQLGDFTFPMSANTVYEVDVIGAFTSAVNTTGVTFQVNGPSTPTRVAFWRNVRTNSVNVSDFLNDYLVGNNSGSALGSSAECFFEIRGFVYNGATEGDFQVLVGTEVDDSAITILPGSNMRYRKIY